MIENDKNTLNNRNEKKAYVDGLTEEEYNKKLAEKATKQKEMIENILKRSKEKKLKSK